MKESKEVQRIYDTYLNEFAIRYSKIFKGRNVYSERKYCFRYNGTFINGHPSYRDFTCDKFIRKEKYTGSETQTFIYYKNEKNVWSSIDYRFDFNCELYTYDNVFCSDRYFFDELAKFDYILQPELKYWSSKTVMTNYVKNIFECLHYMPVEMIEHILSFIKIIELRDEKLKTFFI